MIKGSDEVKSQEQAYRTRLAFTGLDEKSPDSWEQVELPVPRVALFEDASKTFKTPRHLAFKKPVAEDPPINVSEADLAMTRLEELSPVVDEVDSV